MASQPIPLSGCLDLCKICRSGGPISPPCPKLHFYDVQRLFSFVVCLDLQPNPPSSSPRSGMAQDALEVEAGTRQMESRLFVRSFVFSVDGMHIITARKFVVSQKEAGWKKVECVALLLRAKSGGRRLVFVSRDPLRVGEKEKNRRAVGRRRAETFQARLLQSPGRGREVVLQGHHHGEGGLQLISEH